MQDLEYPNSMIIGRSSLGFSFSLLALIICDDQIGTSRYEGVRELIGVANPRHRSPEKGDSTPLNTDLSVDNELG